VTPSGVFSSTTGGSTGAIGGGVDGISMSCLWALFTERPNFPARQACDFGVSSWDVVALMRMQHTSRKSYPNTTVTRPLQYAGKQSI
jgi:hypothetical protein